MPLPTISDAHVNFIKTKRIYIKIDMLHPLLDHTLLSNLSVYFVNISMNAWMHETCHSFSLSYEWWFSIKKRHILPTIHFPIAFVSLRFFFLCRTRVWCLHSFAVFGSNEWLEMETNHKIYWIQTWVYVADNFIEMVHLLKILLFYTIDTRIPQQPAAISTPVWWIVCIGWMIKQLIQ